MALETHPGYKGKLNHKICKTAPYFADRTVEIIFNVPILIRKPETNADYAGSLTDVFRNVAVDDYVVIIWIENLRGMHSLPHKIDMSGLVYICVHPLQNATGLYWIKIITPTLSHSSGTDKKIGKGKGVIWNVSTKLAENHLVSKVLCFYRVNISGWYVIITIKRKLTCMMSITVFWSVGGWYDCEPTCPWTSCSEHDNISSRSMPAFIGKLQ